MPLDRIIRRIVCLELSKRIEQLKYALENENDEKRKLYKELQLSILQDMYDSECRGV